MFHDLNLPEIEDGDVHLTHQRGAMAVKLGWGTVAMAQAAWGTLTSQDRCKLQRVPQEAVDLAACDAAPALAFAHSLLQRPGGGKQQPASDPAKKRQPPAAASTAADAAVDAAAVSDSAAGLESGASRTAVAAPGNSRDPETNDEAAEATAGAGRRPFQQLTRLTYAAEEAGQAGLLAQNLTVTATYDIIAVQPLSDRVMQQACTSLPVDLISIDLAKRLPFRIKPSLVQAAIARGVHFEVCYAPALREATARRNVFANAQALARATRGRSIVLSSGARSAIELRGPADAANLATLFGLSQRQAKAALTEAPAAVIMHSEVRRAYKGALTLQSLEPQRALEEAEATNADGAPAAAAAAATAQKVATPAAPVGGKRKGHQARLARPPPPTPLRGQVQKKKGGTRKS